MLEEFEQMFVDNMKILTFKAFRKGSKVTERYCSLIDDTYKINKYAKENESRIGIIADGLQNCFNDHLKNLLDLNVKDSIEEIYEDLETKRKNYEVEIESLDHESLRIVKNSDLEVNQHHLASDATTVFYHSETVEE